MNNFKTYIISFWVALLCLSLNVSHAADLPKEITLATTDWCPYVCPSDTPDLGSPVTEGIAVELITEILAKENIKLTILNFPWTYSIRKANEGKEIDGLLTAVVEEAPALKFTSTPTMSYQVCMFGPEDADWQFKPAQTQKELLTNLGARRIGIIDGYGYDPVFDRFAANSKNSKYIERVSYDNGLEVLLKFAERYRIHAFPSDKFVVGWHIRSHNHDHSNIKNLGCFAENPFFMAFSPKKAWHQEMLTFLDDALKAPSKKDRLAELVKKYTTE